MSTALRRQQAHATHRASLAASQAAQLAELDRQRGQIMTATQDAIAESEAEEKRERAAAAGDFAREALAVLRPLVDAFCEHGDRPRVRALCDALVSLAARELDMLGSRHGGRASLMLAFALTDRALERWPAGVSQVACGFSLETSRNLHAVLAAAADPGAALLALTALETEIDAALRTFASTRGDAPPAHLQRAYEQRRASGAFSIGAPTAEAA